VHQEVNRGLEVSARRPPSTGLRLALVLHFLHEQDDSIPEISIGLSLSVIVSILAVATEPEPHSDSRKRYGGSLSSVRFRLGRPPALDNHATVAAGRASKRVGMGHVNGSARDR
jgi:hypothetical protein